MRIAYDYQIFGSQRYGGISRYFFEIANHLAGFESNMVQCLINSPVYVNEYLRNSSHELQICGVSLPPIPRVEVIYRSINRFFSPLFMNLWSPNIVHHTYYSQRSVVPASSKTVVTVYDMIHELYPQFFSPRDPTRAYKKIAVEGADHVICISENTRRDLVQLLGVPSHKTSVVHLGFSLLQAEEPNALSPRRPFLLHVGGRAGYKNFERLLIAYASRRALFDQYDLVTFGQGRLQPRERDLIKDLNIPLGRVRQLSGGDSVLSTLYKQAAMFVYPSLYEGFGIPLLEAMSFGCPVACSNTSSIPEVVGDAALQFNPSDTDAIADALVALSSSPALRAQLIELGKSRVRSFSWNKCAMQTLEIYKKLLQ